MTSAVYYYEDNLLKHVGGAEQFDYLVLSYCERILNDPSLNKLYNHFKLKNLAIFQKETLLAIFLVPGSERQAERFRTRIILRHHQLFQMGLNETHFDRLVHHFSKSLQQDCRVSTDIVELCEKRWAELRPIFQENGKSVRQEANQKRVERCRLVDSMKRSNNATAASRRRSCHY
eukprot:scaffold16052_cov72-Cylindrotheca_fusiformis.AAC.2